MRTSRRRKRDRSGRTLHRLFREAIAAGKLARARTRIGGESVSIATAAVEAARVHLGTLEGKSILVVGAGKMGRAAVKRLRQEGAARVIVTNRTLSRSRELIEEAGFGEAVEMPELSEALAAADVVVASTGASHFVLDKERVAAAMASRPQRHLFIVDIAVPRDVDPAVADGRQRRARRRRRPQVGGERTARSAARSRARRRSESSASTSSASKAGTARARRCR